MKKLLEKTKISTKWLAIAAVFLFSVAMVPVYRLMIYARLAADDLWYGSYMKRACSAFGFPKNIWYGFKFCVQYMWNNWQGTYSSAAMMSLAGFWGDDMYFIGPAVVTTMFIIGNYVLTSVLAKHLLQASRGERVLLGVISTLTQLELIYTAQQGIYWYNAAVHYTFMHGVMCLTLAVLVKLLFAEKVSARILLTVCGCLLAAITAGSNFATTLYGLLFIVTIAFFAILAKNKRVFCFVPVLLVYITGTLLNVLAPGNAFRQACYQGTGAVMAVIKSFQTAIVKITKVCDLPVIFFVALAGPLLWNLVKKSTFSFRFPGFVSIYSFCLYASGFSSSWYGMGSEPLSRTWAVIKFTFIFLLFINVGYWMGYVARVMREKGKELAPASDKLQILYYIIPVAAILICFVTAKNQAGNWLSYGSYYYVHTGEANNFATEFDARAEYLLSTDEKIVEVEPLHFRPWFLAIGNDNPSEYAVWYGKWDIQLKQSDQ